MTRSRCTRVSALLVVAALAAVAAPSAARAADPPRVLLIATGGTISNRNGGRLTAEQLAESIPTLGRYARAETEQFTNVASSDVTLAQWLQLARHVNEVYQKDPGLAGIVVTSGTDTLEELAYYLDLTVRDARPVVVVGSMRNPSTLGYEGAANLLEGFRVAADPASRNKGALVVLNDEINSAREVTKTDALRLETFQSRGYGVLGVVDSDRVVYYRDVVKRHTARSEFDLAGVTALPRVDVLLVYQGAPGDLIKAAVDGGAKGIVIGAAGAGAIAPDQAAGLQYAASKGVVVVVATRTGSGRIAADPTPPPAAASAPAAGGAPARQHRRPWSMVAAEDLTPIKARILLMLALTRTDDPAVIQRMFTEY